MTQCEKKAEQNWAFATLHQTTRDIVDGSDMVRVKRVAQAKAIRQESGAEQGRFSTQAEPGPGPYQNVGASQKQIQQLDFARRH